MAIMSRATIVVLAASASILGALGTKLAYDRVRRDVPPPRPWPECIGATVELNELLGLAPIDDYFAARVWKDDAASMVLLANLAAQCSDYISRPGGRYYIWSIPFGEGFTGYGWPLVMKRPTTRIHIEPHFKGSREGYTIIQATFDGAARYNFVATIGNWLFYSVVTFVAMVSLAVGYERRRRRLLRGRSGFPVIADAPND